MTQPDEKPSRALTRPAIGVLVDPERMTAARKSAMLERTELVSLSQALDLIKLAAAHGIETGHDPKELAEHPGPRKLIDAMNYARAVQDKPPLHIEDLQVPGEVLIPEPRDDEEISPWEQEILDKQAEEMSAIDAYQEASNEIYYAQKDAETETG